jgi:hypothetical protein
LILTHGFHYHLEDAIYIITIGAAVGFVVAISIGSATEANCGATTSS